MPRKTNVAADAVLDIGTQYYWAPFMTAAGIPGWIENDDPVGNIGQTADTAICCFDYLLLLAIRRQYLTRAQVDRLYGEVMHGHTERGFASETTWRGLGWLLSNWVWQDWPNPLYFPTSRWRPRRGDVVFLTEPQGGNHVVLSLGPNRAGHVEVISFGEGMQGPGPTRVNRLTIAQLRATYQNVNRVTFVDPLWS